MKSVKVEVVRVRFKVSSRPRAPMVDGLMVVSHDNALTRTYVDGKGRRFTEKQVLLRQSYPALGCVSFDIEVDDRG